MGGATNLMFVIPLPFKMAITVLFNWSTETDSLLTRSSILLPRPELTVTVSPSFPEALFVSLVAGASPALTDKLTFRYFVYNSALHCSCTFIL